MNPEKEKNLKALESGEILSREQWKSLIKDLTKEDSRILAEKACRIRDRQYGKRVFIRGLIEFTNYCRNDCYYCGIRRSNCHASRYRLTGEEILECCRSGYELGFRTFVLQGGEDPYFNDERMTEIIRTIKKEFPDCALTLSIGEKERKSYEAFRQAGADRYLLRHETATASHYAKLHPPEMSLAHRLQCLDDLRDLGYQTGCGIMVGSPYQTWENLLADLRHMQRFDPQMVGIGPFIPAKDTPFADEPAGSLRDTLWLLAVVRLALPRVLLPATTALATLDPRGREAGLRAGANVLMPNLSPLSVRKKYALYDNKATLDGEAAENVAALSDWLRGIGYEAVVDRGDYRT